jgi:hypothetical protein
MKKQDHKKKVWTKPVVHTLNIKKDTFSGSGVGAEFAQKAGPPKPP